MSLFTKTSFLNEAEKKAIPLLKEYNIEIKNLKFTKGHDSFTADYPYGNIYVNSKKVGTFEEDTWGGGYQYNINKEFLNLFKDIAKKCGTYKSELGIFKFEIENILMLLVDLKKYETKCKKKTFIQCKDKKGIYIMNFNCLVQNNEIPKYLDKDVIEYEILNERYVH